MQQSLKQMEQIVTTDNELKPILSCFSSEIEPDDVEFEWEYLLDQLDAFMKERTAEYLLDARAAGLIK